MLRDAWKVLAVAIGSAGQILLSATAALITTFLLPVDDRGRYVLLITVIAVTAPLAGAGSNVGLRRQLPQSASPAGLESSYLRLSVACAAIHGLLSPAVVWLVTSQAIPRTTAEAGAVALLGFTQVLAWQFVDLWYGRQDFRTGAVYATLNAFAALLAAATAAITPALPMILWVQALGTLLVQGWQGAHLYRTRPAGGIGPEPRSFVARRLVAVGAPSLIMTAGMSLTFRLDRLILGALSGPQSVAVYALAGSFSELPRFIPAAFGQVANGHAARSTRRLALRPYLLPSGVLTIAAALAAMLTGAFVIRHLGPRYEGAAPALIVLVVAELLLMPYSIVIRMILGGGRVHLSAGIGAAAIGLSLGLYWYAIARHGVMGAALASAVVYTGVSAICLFIHRRQREA